MSQESNKEPVGLEVGRVCGAAVYMKKGLESDLRASSRSASSPFFSLLRKPGRRCRPDCRLVNLCEGYRRFAAAKRAEGALCGARRRSPLVFPAGKTAFSRGRSHASSQGRPVPHRGIASAKRTRKKTEVRGASSLAHSNLLPFFVWPAQTSHPNAGFQGCSRGAFTLKAAPRTSLPPRVTQSLSPP